MSSSRLFNKGPWYDAHARGDTWAHRVSLIAFNDAEEGGGQRVHGGGKAAARTAVMARLLAGRAAGTAAGRGTLAARERVCLLLAGSLIQLPSVTHPQPAPQY